MDSATPGSPGDPHFPQAATSKRKPEVTHIPTQLEFLVAHLSTQLSSAASIKKRARVSYSCQECHRRKQKASPARDQMQCNLLNVVYPLVPVRSSSSMRSCTCFGQSVLEQVPDKEPPSQCVARKVPELCKNYQPGKTEDFNARLSRIEQIIDQVFPQYASGELTSPSSPREFSANLPGTNGPWGSINNGSNDQLMELDRSQDDQKSTASSRSSSPVPGPEPSGGMLEAGKWFGTSALGSVNSRPIIEQVRKAYRCPALSLLTSILSSNTARLGISGPRSKKSIHKLPTNSRA